MMLSIDAAGLVVLAPAQDGAATGATTSAAPARGVLGAGTVQDSTSGEAAPLGANGAEAAKQPDFSFFFIIVFGMLGLMIVTSMMGGRKEKKRKAELMSSIGKHTKVQTVGGIIGTVQEVTGDGGSELIIMTDRASNTRIRVARSAVQQVLSGAANAPAESSDTESDDTDKDAA